jgi:hypothetical protein
VEWSASVALTADRRSARRRCETGKGKTGGYSIRRVRRGRTRKIEWHDDVLDFRPFHWNWPDFFSPNKTPKKIHQPKNFFVSGMSVLLPFFRIITC